MGESDSQYLRWTELMDRTAAGASLSGEELAFCERYAAEHPACERELELLEKLSDLHAAPNAESRALVDATLAGLAAEAAAAERNELSELKRGSRVPRFVWVSGATALAAIAAAVLLIPRKPASMPLAQGPAPRIELVYAAGEVRVDGKPLGSGSMLLTEGSALEVGRGSACVAMDPDINICAGEQTRLRLSRTHSAWRRLDLEQGEVAVQLAPQPEGWRLSVVADGVWSTAFGTAFTVQRDKLQGVRTTVLNGKVRVGSESKDEQMVVAHQRTQVHHGQSKLDAISRSEESSEWAMLRPAKLWSNPVSATLELRGLPARAEVSLDDEVIGVAPLSSLIPAGPHELAILIQGRVVATREFVSEVGQLTAISFEGQDLGVRPVAVANVRSAKEVLQPAVRATRHRAEIEPEPAVAALTPAAELLAQARRSIRIGRFSDAAAQYQALRQTYPDSPEARTVLVSLAEVQLDRLKQPQQALEHLEQYLGDGGGALVEEARRVRIRALHALGDTERETAAIEEFLQAHPRSFQAAALQHRLAELKTRP